MRVTVCVRCATAAAPQPLNCDRNDANLAVGDAAFGDDRLREFSDLGGLSAKHSHFQTTLMVEMDMHRGDLKVVMIVVRVGQSFASSRVW
jgi:hypothetical protein